MPIQGNAMECFFEICSIESGNTTMWRAMIFDEKYNLIEMRSFRNKINAENYADLRSHWLRKNDLEE